MADAATRDAALKMADNAKLAFEHGASKSAALSFCSALGAAFRACNLALDQSQEQNQPSGTVAFDEATRVAQNKLDSSVEGAVQVAIGALIEYADNDADAMRSLGGDVASRTDRADVRLRALSSLYNAAPNGRGEHGRLRYEMLLLVIAFGERAGLSSALHPVFAKVEEYGTQWELSPADRRGLLDAVASALVAGGDLAAAHEYKLKALHEVDPAANRSIEAEAERAAAVVTQSIMLDNVFRFDELPDLESVRALEHTHALLWELLNILISGGLKEYLAFHNANSAYVADTLKLSHEALVRKMRLLTFASLGIAKQELSYEEVASALEVEVDEVEAWVIRAISSGLLDARVDELGSRVVINRSTTRVFTKQEWQPLHQRIELWKRNLDALSSMLAAKRAAISAYDQ
uniref:Eukaryotic translation initiation factor 3 subunit M n=1 Tax=Erythrolobus madagascarensis TaxID=708628 RepID=A0A7S0T610_9RHOD